MNNGGEKSFGRPPPPVCEAEPVMALMAVVGANEETLPVLTGFSKSHEISVAAISWELKKKTLSKDNIRII